MELKLEGKGKKTIEVVTKSPFDGLLGFIIRLIAVLVSWFFNKSIGWAIFHFIFGFLYLIYKLITGAFKDGKFIEIIQSYF